jgi:hypothetical protein
MSLAIQVIPWNNSDSCIDSKYHISWKFFEQFFDGTCGFANMGVVFLFSA